MTNLYDLDLRNCGITNIKPLVDNPGIGNGDFIHLEGNTLDPISESTYIKELIARGANVYYP